MEEKNSQSYFSQKIEERKSTRNVQIISRESSEAYDISPYSIRPDEGIDLLKLFFGALLCILSFVVVIVAVKNITEDKEFDGRKHWCTAAVFLCLGVFVLFKTFQNKYRLLDNYS